MPDELQVLAFLAIVAAFWVGGWGIVRAYLSGDRLCEDALRIFLVAVALAVFEATALGLAGWFTPVPAGVAAGLAGILGAALLWKHPRPYRAPERPFSPAARAVVCLGVGTVVAKLVLTWPIPSLVTDTILYHLPFTARWLQLGTIVRAPTFLHAGAHAYFPLDQEVLSLWAMLPFPSEVVARFIQVPFLFAAALAVYVLATARGLARDSAAALAGAFLLFRPFLNQALGGPNNDVTLSALLLAALHACDAVREDRVRGGVLFGIAFGLFLGTKYVGVPFGVPLVVALVLARPGWRALGAAIGLTLVLGGTWYVWNLVQTGDPVYPGDLAIGGVTLAKGLYAPAIFPKARSLHALVHAIVREDNAFSLTPCLAVALGLLWLLSHARRKGSFAASTTPLLLVILYELLVPLEDSRYLMPAFAALAVSAGSAAAVFGARWSLLVPAALAAIAFREAIVLPEFVGGSLVAAAALFVAWTIGRRLLPLPSKAVLGATGGLLLVAMGAWPFASDLYYEVAYGPDATLYEQTYGPEGRGWTWIADATRERGATIAYAGTGLIFPLFGERLKNRVLYVPVREGPERLVHAYGAHYTEPTRISPLEQVEEVLRAPADRVAWLQRLARERVDYLFVTGAERTGAPLLEETWADEDPARFEAAFRWGGTVIYRVAR